MFEKNSNSINSRPILPAPWMKFMTAFGEEYRWRKEY